MTTTFSLPTTASIPFVDLKAQYAAIAPEVEEAISEVLRSTEFILGSKVSLFEEEFAAYCGVEHAIGVDTGLSGLELILRGYGIGPGDEVITAANSFVATALAISSAGATPVLVDCESGSFNIDPSLIESAITPATRAIMPVHLYGQPADMTAIGAIAERHGLLVIEDACQAHGARFESARAGGIGNAAAFSFYPAKNLGAYGDGGVVTTNDSTLAGEIRMLRNYGQREKYNHVASGFNRRLDTLQAAVLSVKLPYLDSWNSARREIATAYLDFLQDSSVKLPIVDPRSEHVWHLFVIRTNHRAELQHWLQESGISTGIHYPFPIHLQPAYSHLGNGQGSFPNAELLATEILSLPMYPELPHADVQYISERLLAFRPHPSNGDS